MNDVLEALIDLHGLPAVLNAIAQICSDKAEHIAVNWQDTATAKVWVNHMMRIDNLARKLEA